MHPLLHLIPAGICTLLALGLAISMAQDVAAHVLRVRSWSMALGSVAALWALAGAAISAVGVFH